MIETRLKFATGVHVHSVQPSPSGKKVIVAIPGFATRRAARPMSLPILNRTMCQFLLHIASKYFYAVRYLFPLAPLASVGW